jgi:hypothetical protein|uniref:Uncharacterized protein n=1 Tax=viral metagenome TaxID=1070528 RepID=A0A6C0K819_9ZZZZ
MKANQYLPILFIGLAVAVLIVVTNQQREGFGFGMPKMMDPCTLQLAGLNQRVTNLENRANDAQDNANTGVGQIQMVTAS